ncbi:MAG: hypothetical protein C0617_12370 [Desulfuromonas sp.]|uniref:tetratricopeptide repeat protein n=1 Tax=Desulfuromonas sp. TaxID=892 RepID=UPI000CB19EF0|nr:tetratricopeptide repeat protein [Desulfuromonas sp.]PLX83316.1 MAG: hypothetical protein C0617_12370 [Desulfuromonas sp.]
MEIKRLKKQLLREERKRRRRGSKSFRLWAIGLSLLLVLALGGLAFYLLSLDEIRAGRFARAEEQLRQGRYEEATKSFRDLYDSAPDFHLAPMALFQSGETLNLFLKRYPEALLTYLLVVRDYPDTDLAREAQRQAAEIYKYRLQDYGRAVVGYQKLLDRGAPEGDRIQYEIADAYFRLNNFEQARIEFDSLLKDYPDSSLVAEVQYRIAVTLSLEGALDSALEAFGRVVGNWPDSPYALEARFGMAAVLEEKEELSRALQILEALRGRYSNAEALATKIDQVRERIRKKKKAI